MFLQTVVQQLCPQQCLSCSVELQNGVGFCPDCYESVHFLKGASCDTCARPLPGVVQEAVICDQCRRAAPQWDKARAALLYQGATRRMILNFKNTGRMEMSRHMVAWMLRAGEDILTEQSVIVPVPLHWTRRVSRRFNQGAILARGIARALQADYRPDILHRAKRTRRLESLNAASRLREMEDAISLRAGICLKGRAIVLVDDVLTTGATAEACVCALVEGGAVRVDVLTLARVARAA